MNLLPTLPRPARNAPLRQVPSLRRGRVVWAIAVAALAVDVLVCVPFIFDPFGWRGAAAARTADGDRVEYVLFLGEPAATVQRHPFFTAHPALRVEHVGGWAGTMVVSLPADPVRGPALLERLRGQPFVRLVTSGASFCRAT